MNIFKKSFSFSVESKILTYSGPAYTYPTPTKFITVGQKVYLDGYIPIGTEVTEVTDATHIVISNFPTQTSTGGQYVNFGGIDLLPVEMIDDDLTQHIDSVLGIDYNFEQIDKRLEYYEK